MKTTKNAKVKTLPVVICHYILRYQGKRTNSDNQETVDSYEHRRAIFTTVNGWAISIREQLIAWADYADLHKQRYNDSIGNDHYTGKIWAKQGKLLHNLLSCEVGGLSCSSLSSNIIQKLKDEGFVFEDIN
jgi:hypothetical protein